MPLPHLLILAIIQGITEFLPISSSGHLALYPLLTDAPDQGLSVDVAVHIGSLGAVSAYFWRDVMAAAQGGLNILTGRWRTAEARLTFLLALATLPVVAAGLAAKMAGVDTALRTIAVIGWATIIGGVFLYLADRFGRKRRGTDDWTAAHALAMGLAQCFAIAPGASRSGVTMTMARALGYARTDAARLSMLMSVPTIIAAGALIGLEMAESGDASLGADAALAAALSFVAAFIALAGLMRMLRTWTMTPFVIYRMALGAVLLWVAYG